MSEYSKRFWDGFPKYGKCDWCGDMGKEEFFTSGFCSMAYFVCDKCLKKMEAGKLAIERS